MGEDTSTLYREREFARTMRTIRITSLVTAALCACALMATLAVTPALAFKFTAKVLVFKEGEFQEREITEKQPAKLRVVPQRTGPVSFKFGSTLSVTCQKLSSSRGKITSVEPVTTVEAPALTLAQGFSTCTASHAGYTGHATVTRAHIEYQADRTVKLLTPITIHVSISVAGQRHQCSVFIPENQEFPEYKTYTPVRYGVELFPKIKMYKGEEIEYFVHTVIIDNGIEYISLAHPGITYLPSGGYCGAAQPKANGQYKGALVEEVAKGELGWEE